MGHEISSGIFVKSSNLGRAILKEPHSLPSRWSKATYKERPDEDIKGLHVVKHPDFYNRESRVYGLVVPSLIRLRVAGRATESATELPEDSPQAKILEHLIGEPRADLIVLMRGNAETTRAKLDLVKTRIPGRVIRYAGLEFQQMHTVTHPVWQLEGEADVPGFKKPLHIQVTDLPLHSQTASEQPQSNVYFTLTDNAENLV
jgi:hypothetical protein